MHRGGGAGAGAEPTPGTVGEGPGAAPAHPSRRFATFSEFYPFYSSQHRATGTRLLHVIGTSLAIANTAYCLAAGRPRQLLATPLLGYGFAWVGHAAVERNRPATFTYPLWSLLADFRMFLAIITGREPLRLA